MQEIYHGEILKTAIIPVKGLTVENGKPLIDGKPISNLSEGEQLMLCVDVALSKPNNLKLILLDGVEKLSENNRKLLYFLWLFKIERKILNKIISKKEKIVK